MLLAALWIGRLAGGDADDAALLVPAALAGFVANPLWYVLLGRTLGRGHSSSGSSASEGVR